MSETTSKVKSWIHTKAGYPQTLTLSTTDVPVAPAPSALLIQVHAAALNPVDIQLMNFPLNSLPYLDGPKIPARDFSGTVLAAGPETEFEKGDEIYGVSLSMNGTGSLTEVAHIDTKGACIVKKPKHFSWQQAASLPLVYLTARMSIEKCKPFLKASTPSENRLVVLGGSSATGIYTVQIAKSLGWTVLSSCSGRNMDFVKSVGATETVDYTASPNAVVEAVKQFSPGAIIDCVGGTETVGLAPQYVTIVGDKTSRSSLGGSALYLTHPRMVLRWLLGYLGVVNSYECITLDPRKEWLDETTKLDPEKNIFIDSIFDFSRAKEAFERLNTGRARGKVVRVQSRKLCITLCIIAAVIYYFNGSVPQFLEKLWEGVREELLEQLLALSYWGQVPASYRVVAQAILLAILGPADEYLELVEQIYHQEIGQLDS